MLGKLLERLRRPEARAYVDQSLSLPGIQLAPASVNSLAAASTLGLVARELIRQGEALLAIEVTRTGGLALVPCGSWHVSSTAPAEASWVTSRQPPSQQEIVAVQESLAKIAGRSLLWRQPRAPESAALPARQFGVPLVLPRKLGVNRIGPSPPQSTIDLRSDAAASVFGVLGVPLPLVASTSDGTAMRESWRRFVLSSIEPLGKLFAEELTRKLETPVSFDFKALNSGDIVGKARAFAGMTRGGMPLADAAALSGLLQVEEEDLNGRRRRRFPHPGRDEARASRPARRGQPRRHDHRTDHRRRKLGLGRNCLTDS